MAYLPTLTTHSDRPTARMETFSDSVFAIAITLLVFELLVPSPQMAADKGGLGLALLSQWPLYVSFFISFLTILIIWVNHHRMLHLFSAVDQTLVILNGLVLLCVSVIPFMAKLLGAYLIQPDAHIATLIYAVWLVLLSLAFQSLWQYARRRRLVMPDLNRDIAQRIERAYPFSAILYAIAAGVALISVFVSVAIIAGLALYSARPVRSSGQEDIL